MQCINNNRKNIPLVTKKECNCVNPIVKEKSFNEDIELDYDKLGHVYRFHEQALDSVTSYLKQYYKPFELEIIAKTCGRAWEVDPQSIIDIWDSNKEGSALFGTSIHDTLEHYEKFQKIGALISQKRGAEENYALPKHPVLRQIVKDFIAINPIKGDIMTEVLITDIQNGLAGRCDRIVIIDKEKKICRIGDYKINIESELIDKKYKVLAPFDYLPANKITKYQIQMSLYANMLQKQGWVVEGLDVYVYEGEWKYFPLEVLKVI